MNHDLIVDLIKECIDIKSQNRIKLNQIILYHINI